MSTIPVITIDGPTASGKGTVASRVASHLGFGLLDSGALYRLTALSALESGIELTNESALAQLAAKLDIRFEGERILLSGREVSNDIRAEAVGVAASKIATLAKVRNALVTLQHDFQRLPGLVADGRDMGTVIFPHATLKVFLTASVEARAERRYKQLIGKGFNASIAALLQEIRLRDQRDSERAAAPLQKCADAVEVDTTHLSVAQSIARVMALYRALPR